MPRRLLLLLPALPALAFLAMAWYAGRGSLVPDGPRSYATPGTRSDAKGPTYPADWGWLRHTWPYGRYDEAAITAEVSRARSLRAAARSQVRLQSTALIPVGPDNIGGRFSDIEWHPTNPSILYAGAATGGVFKSTDGGTTWVPISDGQLPNLNVGDLAIDRLNPQTVFVGTGEANGGHNNFPGAGVYRSTDGGATWSYVGLGQSASIGRIVVDPTNSQRVFVAAQGSYFATGGERGVYRSTDGGTTWQRVLFVSDSTAATDIVIDPANPNRLLAATWERVRRPTSVRVSGVTSRIYRSLDGGTSWSPLGAANGLPNSATTNVGRIGLALCPTNPSTAYALITDGFDPIGLWRSADFGTTWTNRDADGELAMGAAGFSWYFAQVRVAPDDCNRVYAMDVTFYRSEDGGLTFPLAYGYGNPWLHVDHHALAFHPTNPMQLMQGNDGGLNFSADRGNTWGKVAGLPVNQFYEIGLDPSNPSRLYGGTQDNGTLRTLTSVPSQWSEIFGGDGFYVNVDRRNSAVIYAESQFGDLHKSTNDGASWNPVSPPVDLDERLNWSTPVKLDPQNPSVVYYGSERLWRSQNGGTSWTAVSGDLTDGFPGSRLGTITTIGISPVDSAVVWVGTDDGNLWRGVRAPGGAFTWTDVATPPLPLRWVTRVVPHPTNPQAAWVTYSGLKWQDPAARIFATTNAGASWSSIAANLPQAPINALAVDPLAPQRLFVGTDLGAYESQNGGVSWTYLHPDLPVVSVYDLAIHPSARYLAIGTHGRSMYTMDLGGVLAVGDAATRSGAALLPGSPNPFRARTTLVFTLPRAGSARLAVHDAAGRRVRTLANGTLPAGRHERSWDGRDERGAMVASGRYYVRLELPGGETAARAVVRLR